MNAMVVFSAEYPTFQCYLYNIMLYEEGSTFTAQLLIPVSCLFFPWKKKNIYTYIYKIICGFVFLQLGTCVASDAHPPTTLTWKKNGKPLAADGKSKSSPVCWHTRKLSLHTWRCNTHRPPGAQMFEDGIAYYTFTRDNSFDHRF